MITNESLHSITATNYQLLSANLPPHALHTNHPVGSLSITKKPSITITLDRSLGSNRPSLSTPKFLPTLNLTTHTSPSPNQNSAPTGIHHHPDFDKSARLLSRSLSSLSHTHPHFLNKTPPPSTPRPSP
ncbi:hypothetical protein CXB51_002690 [Gossypium anomalum]|uniref:Uncharacterized protein n=1 Tax=Gossypium anomalum TaxID=47600 RepID=A0A8J5ZHS2_9ROSI|nr:hypothetical protein CXB51_002690 [Gossypium anomalum]